MSTFTHAGVSRLKGEFKVRFANDGLRVKVLQKNGHTDIDIIELKHPMTKEEAVAYLLEIDFATRDGATNSEVQAALLAEQDSRMPKAVKAPKEPKAPKAPKEPKAEPTIEGIRNKSAKPKTTLTKEQIKAQLADVEDAPF
jgi:hypothetical protein